jgi:hypothetical protein
MVLFTTLIHSNLPDGTPVLMTGDDSAFFTVGNGNYFVADFAGNGLITLGSGNSTLFAIGDRNSIAVGSGTQTVVAPGDNDIITIGSNASQSSPTFVSIGSNTTLTVGSGINWIYATGGSSVITTGSGTDIVYAVADSKSGNAPGSELITLGGGTQYTYTTGRFAWVFEGSGINVNWASGDNSTFQVNKLGGSSFITGINSTDTISLSDILKNLNLNADVSAASKYLSVAQVTGAAGETDTVLTVHGSQATATVQIVAMAATSVADLASKVHLTIPF